VCATGHQTAHTGHWRLIVDTAARRHPIHIDALDRRTQTASIRIA
jgi:hypothetical protein